MLALLSQRDDVVVSNRLYGQSLNLLTGEAPRLGIRCTVVDTCDLAATAAAVAPGTKLLVAETITNPTLRVSESAGRPSGGSPPNPRRPRHRRRASCP